MAHIRFLESESPNYADRTSKNAKAADITLAVAIDYDTPGERATRREAGSRYIQIPINADGVGFQSVKAEAGLAALEFIDKVSEAGLPMDGVTINVAGNGMSTFGRFDIPQENVDAFMTEFIRQVVADGRMTISGIRSGGQTGVDEAGIKAAVLNGIDAVVLAPKGWRMRGADGRDTLDEAAFKERFAAAIEASQAEVKAGAPVQWARYAADGFEVSSQSESPLGRAFSAMNAEFLPGTVLSIGDRLVDVGRLTIEEVYQVEVKRSGKNLPPDPSSVLFIPESLRNGASAAELEDASYERGYFPLWAVWAAQHPEQMEALRTASAGRTLTDGFATTRVSQARALSELLAGRTLNPAGVVVDRDTLLAREVENNIDQNNANNQDNPNNEVNNNNINNEDAIPGEAEGQEEPKRSFAGDRDVVDLAYAVAFGGNIFDGPRTESLMDRLSSMKEGRRMEFGAAVLEEVERLYPEIVSGDTAKARTKYGMASPQGIIDDIMSRTASAASLDRMRAEVAQLEKHIDENKVKMAKKTDPAEKEKLNKEIYQDAARRNEIFNRIRVAQQELSIGGRTELDVSVRGEKEYRLTDMMFPKDTRIGVVDISEMSVADVYTKFIHQAPVDAPAHKGSVIEAGITESGLSVEESEYQNGILPLVSLWAEKNPGKMAELRSLAVRIGADGIAPKRICDSVSGRFSSARALTDIVNGRARQYTNEEIAAYFAVVPRPELRADLTRDRLEGYDVFTVGTGVRSEREFWGLVPRDTDVIVDMRAFRRMPKRSADMGDFKNTTLSAVAQRLNMGYVEMPAACGVLPGLKKDGSNFNEYVNNPVIVKGKSKVVEKDGKKTLNVVYDYGEFAKTESFQRSMKTIADLVAAGKKVCILGSRSDPSYDPRGLLVGQALDSMGIRVAHIDTPSKNTRIRSQEQLVRNTLGEGNTLREKRFGEVAYHSDRTFTLPVGEEVVPVTAKSADDVQYRLMMGQAVPSNYGVDVDFRKVQNADFVKRGGGETQTKASILENIKYADFSINFYAQRGDPQCRIISRSALYGINIPLPTQKEDYYSESRINNVASKIASSMYIRITERKLADKNDQVDFSALKVFVGGSTMPNIASITQFDEDAVSGEVKAMLSVAGYALDDFTGISQEDVNHYVRDVLSAVQRELNTMQMSHAEDFGQEYDFRLHISEITSNYDSGVGEAAITAAQELSHNLDIKPVVIYTSPVVTVEGNDTSRGEERADEAMFRNRARGKREVVTLGMLKDQIDAKEAMDHGNALQPGLKDEHFVALWDMGVDNATMLEMMDIAARHNVVILDADDFSGFVENARGYVDLPETVNSFSARSALLEAERKIARWKEDGITVVSAASPLYPEKLERMPEKHLSRSRRERVVDQEDIVDAQGNRVGMHVEDAGYDRQVEDRVDSRRPALLWMKGDITLAGHESVSLLDAPDVVTSTDEKEAIKRFTEVLAGERTPLVTSLDGRSNTSLSMLARDGRVIAVSEDGIPTYDMSRKRLEEITVEANRVYRVLTALKATPLEQLSAGMNDLRNKGYVDLDSFGDMPRRFVPAMVAVFNEHKDVLLSAAEEYPEVDIRDSLRRRSDELAAQRAVRSQMISGSEDVTQQIVDNGGLVVSETPPGQKSQRNSEEPSRGSRIVAWMGDAVAVISEAAASNPSVIEIMAKLVYAPFYIANNLFAGEGLIARAVSDVKTRPETWADKDIQELKPEDVRVVGDRKETGESIEQAAHAVAEAARANRADAERAEDRDMTPEEELAEERRVAQRSTVPMLEPFRRFREAAQYVRTSVGDKMEAAFSSSPQLAEAKIEVLHFGNDTVFVVQENQPVIENAVRARFGEHAIIVDPFVGRSMTQDWRRGTVIVDGVTTDRWPDSADTRPLRGGFDRERVYYYKGRVLDLMDVPNGAMDLPMPRDRRNAQAIWGPFVEEVRRLQRDFQQKAGFAEDAQMRFANAEYVHMPDSNTVEVRRGEKLRCRIWLEDGAIRAVNMPFSNDVQEYHETPVYPVLSKIPRGVTQVDLADFLADIRETLMDRPLTEQRAVQDVLSDRETAEDYQERLDNGFIVPRDDNDSIASLDVAWAAQEGVLRENIGVHVAEEKDRVKLFAAACRQIDRDEKKMASLQKTVSSASTALGGSKDKEERAVLTDQIADAYRLRQDLARRLADMHDLQRAALSAPSSVMVSEDGKTGKMVASVGGYQITVSAKGLKKEQLEAAEEMITKVSRKPAKETVESVKVEKEDAVAEKKEDAVRLDSEPAPTRKSPAMVQHDGPWTRDEALADARTLYVFTDNTDRDSGKGLVRTDSEYYRKYGDGTKDLHYPTMTSAVVRGLDNAFPVSTQRWYHEGARGETGRWHDEDVDVFKEVVSSEFKNIREAWDSGRYDRIMLPERGGIFGGKISEITETRTPKLYAVLQGEFKALMEHVGVKEVVKPAVKPGEIKVINNYKEPELKNDPGYVYIGRAKAGRPKNILSNPFTSIKDTNTPAEFLCKDRNESIARYKGYCEEKYKNDPQYKKILDKLADRVAAGENLYLGCFCKPEPCHGDILREKILELAMTKKEQQSQEVPQEHAVKAEVEELGRWLAAAEKDPALKDSEEYRQKVARVQELIGTAEKDEVVAKDEVKSEYVKTEPLADGFSRGYNADGLFRLLGQDGKPVSVDWFKAIYPKSEGISTLLDKDGKFRYFNPASGALIGGAYLQAADFKEGFALVQRDDRRLNFLKPDGGYLWEKSWFDDARSFSEGKARVRIGASIYMIDTKGSVIKDITAKQDKKNEPEQKPHGGPHKGK